MNIHKFINNNFIGSDKISNIFFTQWKFALAFLLLLLLNKFLKFGIFPEWWKIGYVSPILENGDKIQINNYCLISVISIIF